MKIFILTLALLGLLFIPSCNATISENQIRILFNNGTATNMTCTSSDMDWIMKIIAASNRKLRQGQKQLESLDVDESSSSGRNLGGVVFYPASCKTACRGFATGTCVVAGCKGFRRELQDTEEERGLQTLATSINAKWCDKAKQKAQVLVDSLALTGLVSSSCTQLLKMPYIADCLKVVC